MDLYFHDLFDLFLFACLFKIIDFDADGRSVLGSEYSNRTNFSRFIFACLFNIIDFDADGRSVLGSEYSYSDEFLTIYICLFV